jgi:galactose-1-phosphate uridylyltransferase
MEFRFDPLTGRSCRLTPFSLDRIKRPDLESLVLRSRQMGCPFCPPTLETIIPRFTPDIAPEGNIRIGRAVAFPNSVAYDAHSAVVVISEEHFIPLRGFTLEDVFHGLLAAHTCVKRVQRSDPEARYNLIAWNYMPPSGGSLIHPHVQCNLGPYPTNYQRQILEASEGYYDKMGTNFWGDLVQQEKETGQRYIGAIGRSHWLTSFAPRGRLSDILAVFEGRASVAELDEADLRDLAAGLRRVFRFLDELNVLSFNLATYSGFDQDRFWAQARITPRSLLLYSPVETSDQFYFQVLHDENVCILPPEEACNRLKKQFQG